MKLAFLGLGIMGLPMARHLKNRGYDLQVWNRNQEKVQQFWANVLDLEDVVSDADVVLSCLGNDDSVANMGERVLPILKKGAIWIDHTTISAELTQELFNKALRFELHFLEAPVTGGQVGAENGQLMIMCGGDYDIFQQSTEILHSYATNVEYFGAIGSGQRAKMANQIAIAGIIQSLAEAINFAEKAGLDANKLFKLVSGGAGGSWQMQHRHELMVSKNYKENFGFPVEWMVKDLSICMEEGARLGASLEVTDSIMKKFQKVKDTINSRFDTSSLILLLK